MAYNEIRTINNIQLEDIRARQSIQELDNKKANKSDIVNGLNFKGTTTYSALPTSDNSVGDFYYVTDGDGTNGEGNYAWNGTAWYFSGKTTDFGDISTKANAAVNNAAFEEGKLKVTKNDGSSTETEVIDSSLTKSGKAADAKITGDAVSQLKEDLVKQKYTLQNDWTAGFYVSQSDGELIENEAWKNSEFIAIPDDIKEIEFLTDKDTLNGYNAWYDENKKYINYFDIADKTVLSIGKNIPNRARWFRVSVDKTKYVKIIFHRISSGDLVHRPVTFDFYTEIYENMFYYYAPSQSNQDYGVYFKGNVGVFSKKSATMEELKSSLGAPIVNGYILIEHGRMLCYDITNEYFKIADIDSDGNNIPIIANMYGHCINEEARQYIAWKSKDHKFHKGYSNSIEYVADDIYKKTVDIQLKLNGTETNILFFTDVHHGYNFNNNLKTIESINIPLKMCDFAIEGGDNVTDVLFTRESMYSVLKELTDKVYSLCFENQTNFIALKGNHDDITQYPKDYNYQNLEDVTTLAINDVQLYNVLQKKAENYCVFDDKNPTGLYCYYDVPKKKIRIFCVNTNDYPFIKEDYTNKERTYVAYKYDGKNGAINQKQLSFFADALTNTPDDYSLIVFSHIPLIVDYRIIGHSDSILGRGDELLVGMIKAWKNGTTYNDSFEYDENIKASVNVSFNKEHTVIGCFSGHTHYDNSVNVDGIQYVTTLNYYTDKWSDSPERLQGTKSEIAYDMISIDSNGRQVNLYRFGAGSDREFSY